MAGSILSPHVTESMLFSVKEVLLERIIAVEEGLLAKLGQTEDQVAAILERANRHDQALMELSSAQGRLGAPRQAFPQAQAAASVVSHPGEKSARYGQVQDAHGPLEAIVQHLQRSVSLCAVESEVRIRFEGATADLRQLRSEAEQDIVQVKQALAGAEMSLHSLVAEAQSRLEEELAQLRKELRDGAGGRGAARGDSFTRAQDTRAEVDARENSRALLAKLDGQVAQLEAKRREDMDETRRQFLELQTCLSDLVGGLDGDIQATRAKVAAVDSSQTAERLRVVSELTAKADSLQRMVKEVPSNVSQVRSTMLETTASARRQGERLEDLENALATERECRVGLESRLAHRREPPGPSVTSKVRALRMSSPSSRRTLKGSSVERPSAKAERS